MLVNQINVAVGIEKSNSALMFDYIRISVIKTNNINLIEWHFWDICVIEIYLDLYE